MKHCLKSVQIRSFFWFVFSFIRTECRVNLHIQSECRKIPTRRNSVFGQFSRSEMTRFSLLLVQLKQRKKAKTGKPTYQIDYNFLMQNLFFVKNFTKLSIQFHRLQLSLLSLFTLILLYIR